MNTKGLGVLGRWEALTKALLVVSIGFGAGAASGQITTHPPAEASPAPAAVVEHEPGDAPPSPDASMRAYRAVESWISAWKVPSAGDPSRVQVAGIASCVTLRFGGDVVARGIATSERMLGPGAGDTDVIARATARAIAQAAVRLPGPRDALREQTLKQLSKELAISFEVAGPLTPIEPDKWEEVDRTLAPGLDGVAVRVSNPEASSDAEADAQPVTDMVFPSLMLATNVTPARALAAAVSRVIGEGGAAAALDDPKAIRAARGLRMYRFRVAHIAQGGAGKEPVLLYRGQRLIASNQALGAEALREMIESMGGHLLACVRTPGGGGTEPVRRGASIAKTLLPWTGKLQGEDRGRGSALLAALALTRASRLAGSSQREAMLRTANELLDALSVDESGKPIPPAFASPGDAALVFLALNELAALPDKTLPDSAPSHARPAIDRSVVLNAAWSVLRSCFDGAGLATRVEPASRALVLAAVARGGGFVPTPEAQQASEEPLRASDIEREIANVISASGDTLSGQMPWLGWAATGLARPGADISSAIALRHMRELVWKNQLQLADAGNDRLDMVGGVVFTRSPSESKAAPYPNWHGVRPLAFIATMLRHPSLTEPSERAREITRVLEAIRQIRQLQGDEASAWMFSNPTLAIGGVRSSVWDQTMPTDATSLALLCVVEAVASLEKLLVQTDASRTDTGAVQASPIGDTGADASAPHQ